MSAVFAPERIEKISKIMPQFSKVAQVGDMVLMGLEGDPAFPFKEDSRPSATVTKVSQTEDGNNTVTLELSDGNIKEVSSYTIAPGDVWEFSDESFANVMERERKMQEEKMRAEDAARAEESAYRGTNDLEKQINELRAELEAERQLTRNFHNTYIASLHELANDVCALDPSGKGCQFCRTFNAEYTKMQSRGEKSLYRGSDKESAEEKYTSDDDAESLSDHEKNDLESDYF